MEEKRIADFLTGCKAGTMENKKRRKTWDLCLTLPHSSASTADSLSPRALLSRLRLSLHKPSPARGGGAGDGMRCRMRFPRHRSCKKEKDEEKGEAEGEENEAEVGGGKTVDSPVSEPPASGGRVPPSPDSTVVEGVREGSVEKGNRALRLIWPCFRCLDTIPAPFLCFALIGKGGFFFLSRSCSILQFDRSSFTLLVP